VAGRAVQSNGMRAHWMHIAQLNAIVACSGSIESNPQEASFTWFVAMMICALQ
jgi:hypothetical protein